jgi:hypothetical protein
MLKRKRLSLLLRTELAIFPGEGTPMFKGGTRTNTIPYGTKANAAGLSGMRAIAQKGKKNDRNEEEAC